jgi:hypothetical protein
MNKLNPRLLVAEFVVLVTSVYYFGMTAQLFAILMRVSCCITVYIWSLIKAYLGMKSTTQIYAQLHGERLRE